MRLVSAVSDVVVCEVLEGLVVLSKLCLVVLSKLFWNEGDFGRWMGKKSGEGGAGGGTEEGGGCGRSRSMLFGRGVRNGAAKAAVVMREIRCDCGEGLREGEYLKTVNVSEEFRKEKIVLSGFG